MPINVGVSELPGRTHGKMQVMSNVQAGLNLRAALFELKRDHGLVATVNEGDRSRPDQDIVWFEYLAGGPLAAVRYTSTHDPENWGNAADLGGPGGAILGGTRAHELLDGNHPDGVIGRKWGLYNTGAGFWQPESWHFNVLLARSQKLATLSDSIPDPSDNDEDTTLRRLLMTYADVVTVYQRMSADGKKDEDTYFVAAPGVGADLIRGGELQPLALRIGRQLTGRQIRDIFLADGASFKKFPAARFDQIRAMHSSLAYLSQGGRLDKDGKEITAS